MGTEPPAKVGKGSRDRCEHKADEGQSRQGNTHTHARWWRFHRCFEMVRHGLPPLNEQTEQIGFARMNQARSLSSASAPGLEDAGFCPVTSIPLVMTKGTQFATFS